VSKCTICNQSADPRVGLLTSAGVYYPLCDGCSPINEPDEIPTTIEKCRAADAAKGVQRAVAFSCPRFGVNEQPNKPRE
jgi:hypothetical protein